MVFSTQRCLYVTLNEMSCVELCLVMGDGCLAEGKICCMKPGAFRMAGHRTNQKQVDTKTLSETFIKSQSCG